MATCIVSVAGCMLLDPFPSVERAVVSGDESEHAEPEGGAPETASPCAVEKCETPEESCDRKGVCPGETRWAFQLGDKPGLVRGQRAYQVVADALGHSYVIGYFEGTIPLAGIPPLVSGGRQGWTDAFIVKLGPSGSPIWAVGLPDVKLTSIALAAGGIVVGGSFGDELAVPGCPRTVEPVDETRALIVRFDESGKCTAIAAFGDGRGVQSVLGVAVDPKNDDVLAAGMFTGTLDFGGSAAPLTEGKSEGFYVRLGPGLLGRHAFRFTSLGTVDIGGVIARAGTPLVYGMFRGKLLGRTARGTMDGFTASFDEGGNLRDVDSYGGSGYTRFAAAAVDASDRLVVVGNMADIDFRPYGPHLVSVGPSDMFVMRRALTGTPTIEAFTFGGGGQALPDDVAVDADGNVLVVGQIRGRISIGGDVVAVQGSVDAFVAKYDEKDLSHRWSRGLGDSFEQVGKGVAVDGLGDVLVVGQFQGTVDFGAGVTPLSVLGKGEEHWDSFVARLMP